MKKHNILKVILLSILVVVVCTWIFPQATYQYQFQQGTRVQLGIFDLTTYTVEGLFRYFSYVLLFTLATGMFYGVSYRIPAYRNLLDKIVEKFKGKENIFLAVIMTLIAVIVSVSGLSFGMLFVFPLIISIVLLMGYNKLVAASVTVGSTIVGIMGTTLGVATTSYMNSILGIEFNSEIITKIILLVIGLVLLIYNVLLYAKKVKNNTDKVTELVPISADSSVASKSLVAEEKVEATKNSKTTITLKKNAKKENEELEKKDTKKTTSKTATKKTSTKSAKNTKSAAKKSTKTKAYDLKSSSDTVIKVKSKKKVKTWPFILVFDLVVLILIVSTFQWTEVANVDWFTKALDAVNDFKIGGFPIFAKILGNIQPFGQWSLGYEMPALIVLATGFLAFIYGLKFDQFLDAVVDGIKRSMKPAIYMFLVYFVLIVVAFNPFQLNITKFFLDLTKGLNVITMTIIMAISSVLNVENIYVAQGQLPYITSVITDQSLYPLIGIICQSVYGLMMLIAPTSAILIGTLTYLDVPYTQWIKHIWKLFLQLLLVLVIIFFILFLI